MLSLIGCYGCQATALNSKYEAGQDDASRRFLGRALWSPSCDQVLLRLHSSKSQACLFLVPFPQGVVETIPGVSGARLQSPAWSADGRHIACTIAQGPIDLQDDPCQALAETAFTVYEYDTRDRDTRVLIRDGRGAAYSPDGRYVAYLRYRGAAHPGESDVLLLDRETEEIKRLDGRHVSGIPHPILVGSPDSTAICFYAFSLAEDETFDGLCVWRKVGEEWTLHRSPRRHFMLFSRPRWTSDSRSIDYFRPTDVGTEAVRWSVVDDTVHTLWEMRKSPSWISFVPKGHGAWYLRFIGTNLILEEYDQRTDRSREIRHFEATEPNENVSIDLCSDRLKATVATNDWIVVVDRDGNVVAN